MHTVVITTHDNANICLYVERSSDFLVRCQRVSIAAHETRGAVDQLDHSNGIQTLTKVGTRFIAKLGFKVMFSVLTEIFF